MAKKDDCVYPLYENHVEYGITLRTYISVQVMASMLSRANYMPDDIEFSAKTSVMAAERLIEELRKA